ncbi:MAG: nucleoside recognition protein [Clostridiales bacterium]|nr:nucleoside recognition protein [Clostridiales bacterium]
MNYVIPVLLILLFSYSLIKKEDNYSSFVNGAQKSLTLIFDIFANIVAIFILIELFKVSGISDFLYKYISPVFKLIGIPKELCELIVLKPFSGSGSLALLSNIFNTYGVDSYIGRCASVIVASSETVFYVTSVYFSKTKVKNLSYAIPLALFVTILSSVFACLFCKIL